MLSKFLFASFLSPLVLFAVVFETDKMEDVLPYADEETLVLFDVDDTLISSSTYLGTVPWRTHVRKKFAEQGCTPQQVEAGLDQFWLFVQPLISVCIVDPKTPEVIAKLQQMGATTLGLTAREDKECFYTAKQLASVGVRLHAPETVYLPLPHPALQHDGVIFCGENKKGAVIDAYFIHEGKLPKKVIFIDDRMEQVRNVEEAIERLGIEFVGVRMSRADAYANSFNPDAADLQWALLPYLLSNEEAEEILAEDN